MEREILILHTCCAPCALPIIDFFLHKTPKKIILYWENSNIFPFEEYQRRLQEVQKIAKIYHLQLYQGEYRHQEWLSYIKNHLSHPPAFYKENGERCLYCFRFRLEKVVNFCVKNQYKEWTTTLSVNRWKNTNFINSLGRELSVKYKLHYFNIPLEPKSAYQRGVKLSHQYQIYRQKYCGCEFSLPNRAKISNK